MLEHTGILAHVNLAHAYGAYPKAHERVQNWSVIDPFKHVEVTTNKSIYRASKLVLCAGPWMQDLVPQLQGVCVPERQVIGWFSSETESNKAFFDPKCFPVGNMEDEEGLYYYFPSVNGRGFKLGRWHHRCESTTAETVRRSVDEKDEEILRRMVKKHFPKADGPVTKMAACMFTNTVDSKFVIDFHPWHQNVLLCSPCSGHGFKFCSAVGEALADMVLHGEEKHVDVSAHSLSRDAMRSHSGWRGSLWP